MREHGEIKNELEWKFNDGMQSRADGLKKSDRKHEGQGPEG